MLTIVLLVAVIQVGGIVQRTRPYISSDITVRIKLIVNSATVAYATAAITCQNVAGHE